MSEAYPGSDESLTYLNDYFDFNPLENRTNDKVFGNKAIFTNELLWRTFQEGVYDSLGGASSVIMFQLGQEYGINLGDRARDKFSDVRQAAGFLEKYRLLAGGEGFTLHNLRCREANCKTKSKLP
jgi:hypothetical protein